MKSGLLNLCTVTLGTDAEIVNENLIKFNEIYKSVKLYIICPKKDEEIFIRTITDPNYEIINEETLISFTEFKKIFEKISINLIYKEKFNERLSWYYALILKFCFIHKFYQKDNDHLVIWEGDTIILKKIKFFKNFESPDNSTKEDLLYSFNDLEGKLPKYYGSFITQFGCITKNESIFLFNSLGLNKLDNKEFNSIFSEKVLSAIFTEHLQYDNAMFADYELMGINNLNKKYKKQNYDLIKIEELKSLTKLQKLIAKIFDVKHVTYEHRHPNKYSKNMLSRNQTWFRFFKIIIFFFFQFKLMEPNVL